MKADDPFPAVGVGFPDFELPNHDGLPWRLSDALTSGPLVLVFYRGDW